MNIILSQPYFMRLINRTIPLLLALLLIGNSSQAQTRHNVTDVTTAAGMNNMGFTFGNPIWGDFDGDGHLDLFVDNHFNRPPNVYHNNGNGTFTDISATSGFIRTAIVMAPAGRF